MPQLTDRAAYKARAAALIDTTGSGGTSGQDLRDLHADAADTFALKSEADAAAAAAAANAAALGGLSLVTITQADFDALATKDPATLYIING